VDEIAPLSKVGLTQSYDFAWCGVAERHNEKILAKISPFARFSAFGRLSSLICPPSPAGCAGGSHASQLASADFAPYNAS
jgi:hypothetical protein